MNKPILYCSENCAHSRELITQIKSKALLDNFYVYVIEKEASRLPPFVDRVPLLFHNNRALVDEGLFAYIHSIKKKPDQNVDAFKLESSLTDNFAFIDKDEDQEHTFVNANKNGDFDFQRIETIAETNNRDDQIKTLEEILSNRERDIPQIDKKMFHEVFVRD